MLYPLHPVLKIIEFSESGPGRVRDRSLPIERPAAGLLWIDIEAPTAAELEALRAPFGLHPLAIEDCLTFDQRPKLEEYPEHVFVVIHELRANGPELSGHEIHAFLGKNFLITVRDQPCRMLDAVRKRVLDDAGILPRGIAFVYYLIADAVAGHNLGVLDEITESIDQVEDSIFLPNQQGGLALLFQLKRAVASARRILSPQRDILASLARIQTQLVSERTAFYFRDVYDKLARGAETLESSRELLSNILDAHFSVISQRTNEVMKRLTILSAIFLPLTFVTGFFGQNFAHLPFGSERLMWFALSCCILLPPFMLYWFRRRHWL